MKRWPFLLLFGVLLPGLSAAQIVVRGAVQVMGAGSTPGSVRVFATRLDGESAGKPDIDATLTEGRYVLTLSPGRYALRARAGDQVAWSFMLALPGAITEHDMMLWPEHGNDAEAAKALQERVQADQDVRKRVNKAERGSQAEIGLKDEMWEIDKGNRAWLQQTLATQGWPKAADVGLRGVDAFWLMLQHAPEMLADQLPTLRAAAARGELSLASLALSEDRALIMAHKPQRYGSQLRSDAEGKWIPEPVEDEARLDERRAQMGMEPIADYLRRFVKP